MSFGSGGQRGPWPLLNFHTWYRGLTMLFLVFFAIFGLFFRCSLPGKFSADVLVIVYHAGFVYSFNICFDFA